MTGLELARLYFAEAIAPIVADVMPGLRYTAGLFGDCSDVLGPDDEVSRDHGWGPRRQLLLPVRGPLTHMLCAPDWRERDRQLARRWPP